MFRHFFAAFCGLGLLISSVSAASREEEAKKYAANLTNKDAKIRLTAVQELGKLGGAQRKLVEPYIDKLMATLADKDPKVRGEAAKVLGQVDAPNKNAAITKIADLLAEEKSEVARMGMEMGLGQLGAMAEESDLKATARKSLLAARQKTESKPEQRNIQAALQLINPRKKKN
jgi:HEAT repeat protein